MADRSVNGGFSLSSASQLRLLDAAEGCFARAGFHGASISIIAGKLGVSKATVMHHFPKKSSLYAAVLSNVADSMAASVGPALASSGKPDAMVMLLDALMSWALDNPDHCHIMLREMMDNANRIEGTRRVHLAPLLEQMFTLIRTAQGDGYVVNEDPVLIIEIILGVICYHVIGAPTRTRLFSTELAEAYDARFAEHARDLIWRMLRSN